MLQEQPAFHLGDSVAVIDGVTDPDNEKVEIGGWQGRIGEVDQEDENNPLFLVQWDAPTLRGMPESFITGSLQEGLDFTSMYLSPEDLRPAAPRA